MRICLSNVKMSAGTALMCQRVTLLNDPAHRQALLRLPRIRTSSQTISTHPVRCMASSCNKDDKSWAELAGDAAEVAKSALSKLGKTVSDAARALVPQNTQKPDPPPARGRGGYGRADGDFGSMNPWERERGGRVGMADGLVGGILGRAAGAMLSGAMRQLQNQQAQAVELQEQALQMMQADRRLRSRLGSHLTPGSGGSSTSTSTQIINGRSTTTTTLQFFVQGSTGQQALANVRQAKRDGRGPDISIQVQLPDGQMIKVDGGGGPSDVGGDVIDVEVRDVR